MPEVAENPPPPKAARVADAVDYCGLDDMDGHLHGEVAEGLGAIAEALAAAKPDGVEAVVAWTPVSWEKCPAEIDLVTIASGGGGAWHVLTPVSEAIAPVFGDLPFTPVVDPLSRREWRAAASEKGPAWRHVTHRGVLLYSTEKKQT